MINFQFSCITRDRQSQSCHQTKPKGKALDVTMVVRQTSYSKLRIITAKQIMFSSKQSVRNHPSLYTTWIWYFKACMCISVLSDFVNYNNYWLFKKFRKTCLSKITHYILLLAYFLQFIPRYACTFLDWLIGSTVSQVNIVNFIPIIRNFIIPKCIFRIITKECIKYY